MSSSYYPKKYSMDIDYLEIYERMISKDPSKANAEFYGRELKCTTINPYPIDMKVGDYIRTERKRISGNRYAEGRKEEDAYKVRYKNYYYYVGHYDAAKYRTQMRDYKSGKRKSRPNGRKECKLPKGTDLSSLVYIN